jgi:putative SOS response-associated peptidase YedK
MAGLCEVRRAPDGGRLLTCAVITTEATDDVGHVHDRMPTLVTPDRFAAWLNPGLTAAEEARSLLVPATVGSLAARPVSNAVNNVRNNGPHLVEPLPQVGIHLPDPVDDPATLF